MMLCGIVLRDLCHCDNKILWSCDDYDEVYVVLCPENFGMVYYDDNDLVTWYCVQGQRAHPEVPLRNPADPMLLKLKNIQHCCP